MQAESVWRRMERGRGRDIDERGFAGCCFTNSLLVLDLSSLVRLLQMATYYVDHMR